MPQAGRRRRALFGPIEPGRSQTVTVDVAIPAGTAPNAYPVEAKVTSGSMTAGAAGTIHVVGDTIEFTPGTSAEEPWLFDPGSSQLDGDIHDGRGRFADNNGYFTTVRPARERHGRDARARDRRRVPRGGVQRRLDLGGRCCARIGRSGTAVELRAGATST